MNNKTILIVDDTITNLDILIDLLDQYDVIDATNGEDALEIVNEEKIDLVLLDIMMPQMDGYEVCKKLKSNEKTKDIPIIFITAKTDEESIEKAYDIGGVDYIIKPFKSKELRARVRTQLHLKFLKEKEQQLKHTLQKKINLALSDLHYAQKIAKIGFWQYDIQKDILSVDNELYNILEIDKNEHQITTFKEFLELVNIEDDFNFFAPRNQQLGCNNPCVVLHKIKTCKGNLKYIENRCATQYDTKNNYPLISTGTIQDVTEQQETNLALISKERLVLQQSRLAQMGEMVAMIAHQWRQPLNAISLTVDNLLIKCFMNNIKNKVFQEELKLIAEYSQYLSDTIDDFRGFFRENKTKELTTLSKMVNETLSIVKVSLENKNIKVIVDVDCNTEFKTYVNEVKQVILNLLKNAEDVLLERKVQNPTIWVKSICKPGDNLPTLVVKDNAGGISDEIISKIFEPYFSTNKDKNGTGLGLYMSKTIIDNHCDGKISVSNDSEGAAFTIEFDLKDIL